MTKASICQFLENSRWPMTCLQEVFSIGAAHRKQVPDSRLLGRWPQTYNLSYTSSTTVLASSWFFGYFAVGGAFYDLLLTVMLLLVQTKP